MGEGRESGFLWCWKGNKIERKRGKKKKKKEKEKSRKPTLFSLFYATT